MDPDGALCEHDADTAPPNLGHIAPGLGLCLLQAQSGGAHQTPKELHFVYGVTWRHGVCASPCLGTGRRRSKVPPPHSIPSLGRGRREAGRKGCRLPQILWAFNRAPFQQPNTHLPNANFQGMWMSHYGVSKCVNVITS